MIVLHYSLFAYLPFVEEEFRAYIAECGSSYKVAFFQDEYWFWPERSEMLNRFKVDCVYTCIEPECYEATYLKYTRVPRLVTYLPGYVSEEMVEVASRVSRPDGERRVDIGYRGRLSPDFIWLGKGACEKYEIGVSFREMAVGAGLVLDIETEESKRIYGDAWLAFLGDCRAVLGVEAGASIFDIDNTIFPRYRRFREEHPELSVEQVYERVLFEYDGKGVCYRTMSPRLFEAAAVHSCQISFEGRYSAILKPMVHYIPLKKDFCNFDEVLRLYRDGELRRELTENCYRDLIASGRYSYREFIRKFDEGLQAARVKPGIAGELEHRVTDWLRESGRSLLAMKVEVQQREYQELMNKDVALQVQYMEQQRKLQKLVEQHLSLRMEYVQRQGQLQRLIGQKSALRVQYIVSCIGVSIARGVYSAKVFIAKCGRSSKAFVANALRPYPVVYKLVRLIWRGFLKSEGKW